MVDIFCLLISKRIKLGLDITPYASRAASPIGSPTGAHKPKVTFQIDMIYFYEIIIKLFILLFSLQIV